MKNRKTYRVEEVEKPQFSWSGKFVVLANDESMDDGHYHSSFDTMEEAQKDADERNSTHYISDYSEDEIIDFYNSIDFTILERTISEYLGVKLTYEHSLVKSRDGYGVHFNSVEDLCNFGGLLSKMLKSCTICQFSHAFVADKETGELYLWMTIDFSYEHFDCGSNGCRLCDVVYTKTNGWDIRFDNKQYRC